MKVGVREEKTPAERHAPWRLRAGKRNEIVSRRAARALFVVAQRTPISHGKRLDRVREVDRFDVLVPPLDPDQVGLEEDIGVSPAVRRLEAIGRQLDQETQRILE